MAERTITTSEKEFFSRSDFNREFARVVNIVNKLLERTQRFTQEMKVRQNNELVNTGKKMEGLLQDLSQRVDSMIDAKVSNAVQARSQVAESSLETLLLGEIQEKSDNILEALKEHATPGLPGEPGPPPSDEAIKQALKPFVDEAMKKINNALQNLPRGGTRFGGGAIGDAHIKQSIGRLIKTETPTGDINGVNITYTVSDTIHAVFELVINGEPITDDEYTVGANTITMDTALPAELSGTSFRIKYV